MLYPTDGSAFDMLARFIEHEYVDPADMEMRGMRGIARHREGQAVQAGRHDAADLLDKAAGPHPHRPFDHLRAASDRAERALVQGPQLGSTCFRATPTFTANTFNYIDPRTAFFTYAYSTSPGMAANMENVGAKYPVTFVDANGDFLRGAKNYKLNLPKDIPAALFWSVTVYDPVTGSGLDNGQPFPSLNTMDKPATNADGSTDIYSGRIPGRRKELAADAAGQRLLRILRLYGPTKAFFDKKWKPGDIEKVN